MHLSDVVLDCLTLVFSQYVSKHFLIHVVLMDISTFVKTGICNYGTFL